MQFGIYRGCDYPALIRERKRRDTGKHALKCGRPLNGGGIFRSVDIVEHVRGRAVDRADDDAHHGHKQQRDELYDGHADLKLSRELRADGVDAVAYHQKARAKAERLGAHRPRHEEVERLYAAQLKEEHRGEEGQHRRKTWVIYRGHKPADIVGVRRPQSHFGIVHHAVHLLVLCAKLSEYQRTDYAYRADERNHEHTLKHVAVRERQNLAALDKHAGADDDSDDHGYRRGQAVPFLHFTSHNRNPLY